MSKIALKLRSKIIKRAKGFCEYCKANSNFSESPFEAEHINPISKRGKTTLANLAFACRGCNLFKSDKVENYDVVSNKIVRLFNPRKDIWSEHFTWAKDFTLMAGLTPIGRVTVELLKVNRSNLINQRKMLHKYGKHPPE